MYYKITGNELKLPANLNSVAHPARSPLNQRLCVPSDSFNLLSDWFKSI